MPHCRHSTRCSHGWKTPEKILQKNEGNTVTDRDLESFYQSTDLLGETYNPAQELRFAEIPTFMRAPLVRDLEQVDIGIVGIP